MQSFRSLGALMIWILSGTRLSLANEINIRFQALDTSILNRGSDVCISIFTVNAPCPNLDDFGFDTDLSLDAIESKDILEGTCLSSLIDLQDSLKEQCGSETIYKDYSDGSPWKASYLMEEALYNVDRTCLKKGNGEYCNTWFQIPPKGVPFCDECYKLILWHNTPSPETSTSPNCDIKQSTETYPPWLVSSPTPEQTYSSKDTLKADDMFLSLNYYIRAEDAPYVPIANGTRTDCFHYFWWNEKKAGSPAECLEVADWYELDPEQFFLWNPSLDKNATVEGTPTYDFPCTISSYVSYCMILESPTPTPKKPLVPPSPRAEGEIANCVRWFMAYFPCSTQLRHSRMSMELMYKYNPSLKEDCSGYTLGTHYCYQTLDDYHGYGLRREDKSKSTFSQSTAVGTTSDIALQTEII